MTDMQYRALRELLYQHGVNRPRKYPWYTKYLTRLMKNKLIIGSYFRHHLGIHWNLFHDSSRGPSYLYIIIHTPLYAWSFHYERPMRTYSLINGRNNNILQIPTASIKENN